MKIKCTFNYLCNAYFYYDENGNFITSCDNNVVDRRETERELREQGYLI